MTRLEFLEKLKKALENDLHGQIIQEHINYYDNYIIEEMKNGRSEEQVVSELGDPWMIARTLIETADSQNQGYGSYSASDGQNGSSGTSQNRTNQVNYGISWFRRVMLILGIIGVFVLMIAVVGGLFAIVAPFIVPLLVILFVIRLFGQGRR